MLQKGLLSMIYSAQQAAKLLKISQKEILKRLEAGEIPAYRDGRDWKIPKELLQAHMENRALRESAERRRLHEDLKGDRK